MKKEIFIYWKWKDAKTYSKSWVQDVVETHTGTMLELTESTWYSAYPTRVLAKDIDILEAK